MPDDGALFQGVQAGDGHVTLSLHAEPPDQAGADLVADHEYDDNPSGGEGRHLQSGAVYPLVYQNCGLQTEGL